MLFKRLAAASLLASTTLTALAHEGHGLPGASHWHAGDALLWLAGVAVAAVLYLGNRRR